MYFLDTVIPVPRVAAVWSVLALPFMAWIAVVLEPERSEPVGLVVLTLYCLGLVLAERLASSWCGPRVRKEIRQLTPAWLAALAAAVIPPALLSGDAAGVAGVPLLFTYAVLAASAFGAEFEHRTMGLWLSQPQERSEMWKIKHGVLAAALTSSALAYAASIITFQERGRMDAVATTLAAPLLIGPLAAIGTGPLLALVTRSTLAATVFGIAWPFMIFLIVHFGIAGLALLLGVDPSMAPARDWTFEILMVILALAGVGHLLGKHLFQRFQLVQNSAAEGGQFYASDGKSGRSSALFRTRGSAPVFNLCVKEVHLQAPTLLLAVLMIGVWLLTAALQWAVPPETLDFDLTEMAIGVTVLIAVSAVMVAGAVCIAEERRLGLIEWQRVQPLPGRLQWRIKLAMAAAMAVGCGLLLPAILVEMGTGVLGWARLLDTRDLSRDVLLGLGVLIALGWVAFLSGLFASSISKSFLGASSTAILLILSLASLASFGGLIGMEFGAILLRDERGLEVIRAQILGMTEADITALSNRSEAVSWVASAQPEIWFPLASGFLVLGLARRNWIGPVPSGSRVGMQVAALAGTVLVTALISGSVSGAAREMRRSNQGLEYRIQQIEWEKRLSPATRRLMEASWPEQGYLQNEWIVVPLKADLLDELSTEVQAKRTSRIKIHLERTPIPLTPDLAKRYGLPVQSKVPLKGPYAMLFPPLEDRQREFLLRYCELPDDIRALLQSEMSQQIVR